MEENRVVLGIVGNGLVSGLRPVYHFFQMMQMRALEPVPATRFNFNQALTREVYKISTRLCNEICFRFGG